MTWLQRNGSQGVRQAESSNTNGLDVPPNTLILVEEEAEGEAGFVCSRSAHASEIAALCLTLSEEGCREGDTVAVELSDSREGDATNTARVASPPPTSSRPLHSSNSAHIEDPELDADAPK